MHARGSSDYFDLQRHGCTPVPCGLLLPPDLTLEDWAVVGRALGRQEHALQWRIGDWWNHPGHAYGARLAVVSEPDWPGPAYSTCTNVASVAGQFESSRRRELLTFSHHAEVMHLPPHLADEMLDWCEEPLAATSKPRSVRALREEKNRRVALLAPRTSGSNEPARSVALRIVRAPEPESSEYVLLPLPASPRHESEVQQLLGEPELSPAGAASRPAEPLEQFKALVRYAVAQLPSDAAHAVLLEALEFTEQVVVGGLTRRLQSSGDPGDKVVNLR